jgi:hypothetical protein
VGLATSAHRGVAASMHRGSMGSAHRGSTGGLGARGCGSGSAQGHDRKRAVSTSQGTVHPVCGHGRASSSQPYKPPGCSTLVDVDINTQPIDDTSDNILDDTQHDIMVITSTRIPLFIVTLSIISMS